MAPLFARYDAVADRAQGKVYGGAYWHHPMARPAGDRDAALTVDPSRPVTRFVGIYITRAATPNLPDNYDPRSDRRPGVSAVFDQIEVPAEAGIRVEEGDILVREADGARWRAGNTQPDDTGRVKVTVNRT